MSSKESSRPEMTDKQIFIFQEFKSNLEDILTPYYTDGILFKFLRAKNFDLKKAEDNFRLADSTRKFYFIDTYPDGYVMKEVFDKYKGNSFIGRAKDGTVVRYIAATCDIMGFLQASSSFDILSYSCYLAECDLKALKEDNAKTGRNNNEVTFILDMEGSPFQVFFYKCVREIGQNFLSITQDVYPELWRVILIINVPFIFDTIINFFKPILRDNFIKKMKIANKSSSKELLRMYIDDDVLPAFLGGKRVDSKGDPYCKEFISQGGVIPEKYYLKNCTHLIDVTDPNVETTEIRPRSLFNVPLIVKKSRTKLKVEFRTENGSIMYSVLCRDLGPDSENHDIPVKDEILDPNDELSNVRKVSARVRALSHLTPQEVDCIAINPGIYIIQFDNTGSWFGSRKLFYRITTSS